MNGYKVLSALLLLLMVSVSVLISGSIEAREQTPVRLAKTAVDDYDNVAIGNVGVLVTNYGKFGNYELGVDTFEWPIGSGNTYLFEGRIWFGTKLAGEKVVSTGDDFEWGTAPDARADTVLVITGDEATSEYDTYAVMTDDVAGNPNVIGVELTQRTYNWSISYLDDFIIYDFTFKNISGTDLTECYVGFAMDCDVSGDEGAERYIDDLTGWDPEHLISYMYDSDNPEVPGDDTGGPTGMESPGYIGTMPLVAPAPVDGRVGADTPSSHYWWDWNHDPGSDELKYDYMASGKYLDTPPSPFDYRYLQSYGPYDIPAGKSIRIVIVTGLGKGLAGLQANLSAAKDLFEANRDRWASDGGKWLASGPPPSPGLTVTSGDQMVTLTWDDGSEGHVDPVTGATDFEGYRVWKSPTGIEGDWTLLADFDRIDAFGLNTGLPPKNADGLYEFVDRDVHNGYPYHYAVTVYDDADLAAVGSLESSKTTNRQFASPSALAQTDESKIYVYPNPYKADAPWDFQPDLYNPSDERIRFNNIPSRCTIRIFSLSGDLIRTLNHTSGTGSEDWNLISRNTQKVVSGIYLYNIRGEGVDYIGKFVIIR